LRTSRAPARNDAIGGEESLSRFLTESGHFKKDRVLHKAFEPKFDVERQRRETSVFRILGLEPDLIWAIGAREIEPNRRKRVLARAEISVEIVEVEGLRVLPDEPPERHAVIVDWPEGDDQKDRRKSIQQELASRARIYIRE
jgi:hypothetical protein